MADKNKDRGNKGHGRKGPGQHHPHCHQKHAPSAKSGLMSAGPKRHLARDGLDWCFGYSFKLLKYVIFFWFFSFLKVCNIYSPLLCSLSSLVPARIQAPLQPRRENAPKSSRVQAYLGLGCRFTAAVQLGPLSSGSARWAIWHRDDATHASPPTGRSVAVPGCQCTASDGCRRCRQHPHQSGGREGWE